MSGRGESALVKGIPNIRRLGLALAWAIPRTFRWEVLVLAFGYAALLQGVFLALIHFGTTLLFEEVALPLGLRVPVIVLVLDLLQPAWTVLAVAILLGMAEGRRGLALPPAARGLGPLLLAGGVLVSWQLLLWFGLSWGSPRFGPGLYWALGVLGEWLPLWAAWFLFDRAEAAQDREGPRLRLLAGPGIAVAILGLNLLPRALRHLAEAVRSIVSPDAGPGWGFAFEAPGSAAWTMAFGTAFALVLLLPLLWFLRFLVSTRDEEGPPPATL